MAAAHRQALRKRSAEKHRRGAKKAASSDPRDVIQEVLASYIEERIEEIEEERQEDLDDLRDVDARRAAINKRADDECAQVRKAGRNDEGAREELGRWNRKEGDAFVDLVRKTVEEFNPAAWNICWKTRLRARQVLRTVCPESIDLLCADCLRDRIAHEIGTKHQVRADVTMDEDEDDEHPGETVLRVALTLFNHADLPR